MPEMLHAGVSYTIADRFTVGVSVAGSLGGTAVGAQGLYHLLASRNHGHSLFVGAAMSVFPGGPLFGGNHATVVPRAIGGWEWRSSIGFTTRLSLGGGAEVNGATFGVTPTLSGSADIGWSF